MGFAHLYSYSFTFHLGELPENVFSIPNMCLSSVLSPYSTSLSGGLLILLKEAAPRKLIKMFGGNP